MNYSAINESRIVNIEKRKKSLSTEIKKKAIIALSVQLKEIVGFGP